LSASAGSRWAGVVRVVVVLAVLGGILSTVVLVSCAPDWKASLYEWTFSGTDYRLRLTGGFGNECVVLEREDRPARYDPWPERGKDCAWARVAGGDGWLAGGAQEKVGEQGVLLFGIVPAAASDVVVALTGSAGRRIATKAAGGGQNRVYADFVPGAGPVTVDGIALHDANGGALHVY
jgi:hypothetical protein